MSENDLEDFYLESYAFTTAAAIIGSVDRKVTVLLRDGRNLFGILRTFDQYANLVLQDTVERIYIPETQQYGEQLHQVFLIRGENVVMMGEIDIDKEDIPLATMEKIEFNVASKLAKKMTNERLQKESKLANKMDRVGMTSEFIKSDLY